MTATATDFPKVIDENSASELTGVTARTLQDWRQRGFGPPFIKMGEAKRSPVRYRVDELLAWLEENTITPKGK